MMRQRITEVLKTGKLLVSDGAWGTFLQQKGMRPGECPEQWCVDHYGDVADIAKSYRAAGADMVETNSFGGTGCKLHAFGLASRVTELNIAAVRASREAVGETGWVIASMGPTGKMLVMEDITEEEMYEAFREQAEALEAGGADALCIETMSDRDEAVLAIRAAKEHTTREVICTFTFERTVRGDYRTMMGLSPTDAAQAARDAGADIIGTNCGNGMERMIEIIREMHAAVPELPILVHANAGLPQYIDGKDVFPETPEGMAAQVRDLVSAGARIIGGCCGTTPDHIRAIRDVVASLNTSL